MKRKQLIYAGIGSRKTPHDVLSGMFEIGHELAKRGWILRSGHADGADLAFEAGCDAQDGAKEIYLPWAGFNMGYPTPGETWPEGQGFIVPLMTEKLIALAKQHHPAWHNCSQGAKTMYARNGPQVLGLNLETPATMVVCWTEGARGGGGTGQALRIAHAYNIPIFDLADPKQWDLMAEFANQQES